MKAAYAISPEQYAYKKHSRDDNQKDDQCYGHFDDNLPDGATILIMMVYHT